MTVPPLPEDPMVHDTDRQWISQTYQMARRALARGHRPFAALLVHLGGVIAEYENQVDRTGDVTQHAETGLVALASQRFPKDTLAKSTLYTSTEPCVMCCGAIHFAGILRVVYGATASRMDRILRRNPSGIPAHEIFSRLNPRVRVVGPVMEEEGLEIHSVWSRK